MIGDPVRHSLSPVLHNAAYHELGLDWVFVAFEVADGRTRAALDALRTLGLVGLSVTMPHKTAAAACCDDLSDDAAALHGVNTVSVSDAGRLVGDSTDGEGFLRSLREAGHDPGDETVVVLGAGGAARAVARALGRVGARVVVCARSPEAAATAARLARGRSVAWSQRSSAVEGAALVVNATPIGMAGGEWADQVPVALAVLHPGQVVADLVYHPRETPFLAGARHAARRSSTAWACSSTRPRSRSSSGAGFRRPSPSCGRQPFMHCRRIVVPDHARAQAGPPLRSMHERATGRRKRPCPTGGHFVLQGTLETLALPELLGLLAQSAKTGALWLDAANSSAVLYIVEGRCCAAESSEAGDPLDDQDALLARVIDICFAVERAEDGAFRFGPEEPTWACLATVDLEVAIDELSRLVEEWREIQAVIPSLDCRIRLADDLGVAELTVDRERWHLIVSLDGRRSVRDLVRKTNRPVLDVCHALLGLVDAGAVNVGPPPAPPATPRANGRKPVVEAAVEPEAPYGPGVESPHPGPHGVADELDRDVDPAEKGRYLSAFSGLRDV